MASRRHPLAGQIITIKQGPLKGNLFHVIDFMESQHQGKSVLKIKSPLLHGVKERGYPLDSEVVFGKLLPSFGYICVHDKELQRAEDKKDEEVKAVPEGINQPKALKTEPDNVFPLTQSLRTPKKKKDKDKNDDKQ